MTSDAFSPQLRDWPHSKLEWEDLWKKKKNRLRRKGKQTSRFEDRRAQGGKQTGMKCSQKEVPKGLSLVVLNKIRHESCLGIGEIGARSSTAAFKNTREQAIRKQRTMERRKK